MCRSPPSGTSQYVDVTAGNSPDILTLFDTDIVSYIGRRLLEPLNPYLEKAGFSLDGFVPTTRLAVKNGQVLGVPMQSTHAHWCTMTPC